MKLLTFVYKDRQMAGVLTERGVAPIEGASDLLPVIHASTMPRPSSETLPLDAVRPVLPYAVPPKIWCIGLNYLSHAEDINAVQPEEPGSFMKPPSCMFPPGGEIVLPPHDLSNDVDAEG